VVAAIFLFHGTMKFGIWTAAPEGMPANMILIMKILSIAEPLGGLAVLLGGLTNWASLGLSLIMLGAIYMKAMVMGVAFSGQNGTGWEFDLMILAGCIVLMFMGAGQYSIDSAMKKKGGMTV
jgi:uncharacterized membrane protein YphA (DoxX/SURF4 family)